MKISTILVGIVVIVIAYFVLVKTSAKELLTAATTASGTPEAVEETAEVQGILYSTPSSSAGGAQNNISLPSPEDELKAVYKIAPVVETIPVYTADPVVTRVITPVVTAPQIVAPDTVTKTPELNIPASALNLPQGFELTTADKVALQTTMEGATVVAIASGRYDVDAMNACKANGDKWMMDMGGNMYCQHISDADRKLQAWIDEMTGKAGAGDRAAEQALMDYISAMG
jgi:hypothetical protein